MKWFNSHAEEQEVYAKLLQELGPNALAYSYMASSILAQYQVTIGHRSYGKVRRPAPALCPRPRPRCASRSCSHAYQPARYPGLTAHRAPARHGSAGVLQRDS